MTDLRRGRDVEIENHGSIVLLRPLTEAAEGWMAEHFPDDAVRFNGAVVAEPRYVPDILIGMTADGLVL